MTPRTVCWFSCGAASAVATKMTLADTPDAEIVYTDTGSEHPDAMRFLADCEEWFGKKVTILKSDKYEDTWDVWEKTRFIVGPDGAPCTGWLKKKPRFEYQRPDDIQVFGYTADKSDVKRSERFTSQNPEVNSVFPLIEQGLTKADCHDRIAAAGIKPNAMYELGYENANCLGCPKGGMGYWNKVRVDFPEVFDRMAKLEREIGHAVLSEERKGHGRKKFPVWLDELDPSRGNYKAEPPTGCSLLCGDQPSLF